MQAMAVYTTTHTNACKLCLAQKVFGPGQAARRWVKTKTDETNWRHVIM